MAQIVFSEAGAALGRRVLPQGLNLLGRSVTGAALGRSLGGAAGRALEAAFSDPADGPRVKALHVMEAREGAGVPAVYGQMRVGGQVIWASRFKETKTTRRASGKGGPRVNDYAYSVSFAVALGEGPVLGLRRAWADGEAFDLSGVAHRLYLGDETQVADPLIEMIEGDAPAYRGTAYLVFEDLPLDGFGNRLPQLSFEVVRAPEGSSEPGLAERVTSVNVIPASGEFVYATEIVRELIHLGRERALNANSGSALADFIVSLDQLKADLPRVQSAALTVGWFATSLLAGECEIYPGVETRERRTRPHDWSVGASTRDTAYLVSRDANDRPNYGGTPSDVSVVQAIWEMKQRGLAVTLSPFLFMDVPSFPWRGRMGVSEDGSAAARTEIAQFVNRPNGFRHFILHHAALAAEAGGVEAFLIGSEMCGLTRVRDEVGAFPFVEALVALAAEVKALLPQAKVSYAADWTEYGAYVPDDGSADVLFPLDALWASPDVDFVGIDWYPPMGDWRAGSDHLDAIAGFRGPDEESYLQGQIAGGEAFDWYYASEADRAAQARTPIVDTAYAEHFLFRAKDISGWWTSPHHQRTGGVRAAGPTAWVPGMKPVRLCEIGFAAVDKGTNAPNLFVDPKSSESALPPFSTGTRDDVLQRRALATTLAHLDGAPIVEAAHVWAWDARPFPAWPAQDDIWGDGGNWARGHWLNGRSGLAPLSAVVADICDRGGIAEVDASGLDGLVQGYVLDGVHSVRAALEPLRAAFGFECVERGGVLVFQMEGDGADVALAGGGLVECGLIRTRRKLDKAPTRLRLTYIDAERDYTPSLAEARREGEGLDPRLAVDVVLPVSMPAGHAGAVAARLLTSSAAAEIAEAGVSLSGLTLEPGDRVSVDGGVDWHVDDITDQGAVRWLGLRQDQAPPLPVRAGGDPAAPPPAAVFGEVDFVVMDGPTLPGETTAHGPLVAAWSDPWPGQVRILAGPDAEGLSERAVLDRPATIARLVSACGPGPLGRWDEASVLEVTCPGGEFSSLPDSHILGAGNAALLETDAGWELVQFARAELVAPETWRLSRLLRGQRGSPSAAAGAGARLVLLDDALARARLDGGELGLALEWRAAGNVESASLTFDDRAGLPWRVGHLRARGGRLYWTRRGADVAASWTFPEAENSGQFAVAFDHGSGFGETIACEEAEIAVPFGAQAGRVARIGADGRMGPWVSIALGTP